MGDGDDCPLSVRHGEMVVVPGTMTQYCPHQEHDGRPKSHPLGASEQTRSRWPLGHDSFRRAVITSTLPQVDVALLGG